ncbi:hypothetical protein [Nocardioides sp. Soil805]|uniref:hypothetical protein n=1 Tax=Nocardioides sp. Soil805 TaxID=1736416 RepID=UPI0012E3E12E|nr:hypothetical protein [Nocardioides sp. Soil805]
MASPDEVTWRVTRRWVPWRRRIRDTTDRLPHLPDGGIGDDPISMIIGLLLLIAMLPFLLLMLVAGLEMVLILLVMPFAVLGRVVVGRRWTVEVRCGWEPHSEEQVGSWHHAGLRIHEVAREIQRGQVPQRTLGTPPREP